jgi:hypothetical protein
LLVRRRHPAVGKSLDSFLGVGSCPASRSGTRGVRQVHFNAYDVLGRKSIAYYLKLNKEFMSFLQVTDRNQFLLLRLPTDTTFASP